MTMTAERIARLRVFARRITGSGHEGPMTECLDAIEELQAELDARLPTLASVRGSMPDLTGGKGSVAYVRGIRDAADAGGE